LLRFTWPQQVVLLFAGTQGYLDDLKVSDIAPLKTAYTRYLESAQSALMTPWRRKPRRRPELSAAALKEYKEL